MKETVHRRNTDTLYTHTKHTTKTHQRGCGQRRHAIPGPAGIRGPSPTPSRDDGARDEGDEASHGSVPPTSRGGRRRQRLEPSQPRRDGREATAERIRARSASKATSSTSATTTRTSTTNTIHRPILLLVSTQSNGITERYRRRRGRDHKRRTHQGFVPGRWSSTKTKDRQRAWRKSGRRRASSGGGRGRGRQRAVGTPRRLVDVNVNVQHGDGVDEEVNDERSARSSGAVGAVRIDLGRGRARGRHHGLFEWVAEGRSLTLFLFLFLGGGCFSRLCSLFLWVCGCVGVRETEREREGECVCRSL